MERIVWGLAGGMPPAEARLVFFGFAQPGPPAHIGEGLHLAGHVLVASVSYGVYNLAERPYRGFQEGQCVGMLTGAAFGILGLVVSPIAGSLGAASAVLASIDHTTHRLRVNAAQHARRQLLRADAAMRAPRPLGFRSVLRSLQDTMVVLVQLTLERLRVEVPARLLTALDPLATHGEVTIELHLGGSLWAATPSLRWPLERRLSEVIIIIY
ncbi:hypothetical protein T492DRAFT_68726 [Pavlovales sp. CCMP2436]|nr:hypothetical protein T492DRAFT_68726 [Pavlovales sp. CCMP2436]